MTKWFEERQLPFNLDQLDPAISTQIKSQTSAKAGASKLVSQLSKARETNSGDLNLILAHAWAMTRRVEEGVHIDSLVSDIRRARAIFEEAERHTDSAILPAHQLALLESDIGYWTNRAEEFSRRLPPV